jgi:hypothetical protein
LFVSSSNVHDISLVSYIINDFSGLGGVLTKNVSALTPEELHLKHSKLIIDVFGVFFTIVNLVMVYRVGTSVLCDCLRLFS